MLILTSININSFSWLIPTYHLPKLSADTAVYSAHVPHLKKSHKSLKTICKGREIEILIVSQTWYFFIYTLLGRVFCDPEQRRRPWGQWPWYRPLQRPRRTPDLASELLPVGIGINFYGIRIRNSAKNIFLKAPTLNWQILLGGLKQVFKRI